LNVSTYYLKLVDAFHVATVARNVNRMQLGILY